MLHLLTDGTRLWLEIALIPKVWHLGFMESLQLPDFVDNFDEVVKLLDLQVLDDALRSFLEYLLELDSLEVEPNLELVELLLILNVFLENSLLQNLSQVLLSACLGLLFLIDKSSESTAHLVWTQLVILKSNGLDILQYF